MYVGKEIINVLENTKGVL